MKAKFEATRTCVFLLLAVLATLSVQSQAPIFRFRNPTLISGSAGQVNAVYRFSNVLTSGSGNIDALVRIQAKNGSISLQNIDRTADGYDEAFQPEYRLGATTNAWFEFLITFVRSGTSNPAPQPKVDVSGLDIDGSSSGALSLKEFNHIDMGGGICTFNTLGSQLTLSQVGTAYHGNNFTGFLFGALVDTAAKEVMFSVSNVNVTSITYRVGADNQIGSSSTRYASLYFKTFNYPQGGVLAASNLLHFNGTADAGKIKLNWTLAEGNSASTVVLEKSSTGVAFQPAAEFWVNLDGNTQREFAYSDNKGTTGKTFYRLKIIARSGKTEYSNILHFDDKKAAGNALAIYPSIVQSATTVSIYSPVRENAMVTVADMSGRIVKQQPAVLQQGRNNVVVAGFDQLQKGNYFIEVGTANQKLTGRIIVE